MRPWFVEDRASFRVRSVKEPLDGVVEPVPFDSVPAGDTL